MATLKEHQEVLLELLEEIDRICRKHDISYAVFSGSLIGAVRHKGIIPWDDDIDIVMLRSEYKRFMEIAPKETSELYYVQNEYSDDWPMYFSKMRKNNTTCLEKYHPKFPDSHQGIYLDIFPCDNLAENPIVRKLQFHAASIVIARSLYARGYETNNKLKKFLMACCSILPYTGLHRFVIQEKKTSSTMVHTFFGSSRRFKKGIYPRQWITENIDVPFEHLTVPISVHYHEMLTLQYGDYMRIPSEKERKCKEHAIFVDTEKSYTKYKNYRDGMTWEVHQRTIR